MLLHDGYDVYSSIMSDMLVKLYNLPSRKAPSQESSVCAIRRAGPSELRVVTQWAERHFPQWLDGCQAATRRDPVTLFLAVERPEVGPLGTYHSITEKIVGFACYDVAAKGMFGPMGVQDSYQGKGIGRDLLLTALQAMADEGYAYAVVGWVGPEEFYQKVVGATLIENSEPGMFAYRTEIG